MESYQDNGQSKERVIDPDVDPEEFRKALKLPRVVLPERTLPLSLRASKQNKPTVVRKAINRASLTNSFTTSEAPLQKINTHFFKDHLEELSSSSPVIFRDRRLSIESYSKLTEQIKVFNSQHTPVPILDDSSFLAQQESSIHLYDQELIKELDEIYDQNLARTPSTLGRISDVSSILEFSLPSIEVTDSNISEFSRLKSDYNSKLLSDNSTTKDKAYLLNEQSSLVDSSNTLKRASPTQDKESTKKSSVSEASSLISPAPNLTLDAAPDISNNASDQIKSSPSLVLSEGVNISHDLSLVKSISSPLPTELPSYSEANAALSIVPSSMDSREESGVAQVNTPLIKRTPSPDPIEIIETEKDNMDQLKTITSSDNIETSLDVISPVKDTSIQAQEAFDLTKPEEKMDYEEPELWLNLEDAQNFNNHCDWEIEARPIAQENPSEVLKEQVDEDFFGGYDPFSMISLTEQKLIDQKKTSTRKFITNPTSVVSFSILGSTNKGGFQLKDTKPPKMVRRIRKTAISPKSYKSKDGTKIPNLDDDLVWELATMHLGDSTKLAPECLPFIHNAIHQYFSQTLGALKRYAFHDNNRKSVEIKDMVLLFRRTGILNDTNSLLTLMSRDLPQEIVDIAFPTVASKAIPSLYNP